MMGPSHVTRKRHERSRSLALAETRESGGTAYAGSGTVTVSVSVTTGQALRHTNALDKTLLSLYTGDAHKGTASECIGALRTLA